MSYVVLNSGSELVNAGHSTIFASFTRHRAPSAADPASVIRSTTCTGGIDGARGGCGWSTGETAGGTHTVGRAYLLVGIGVRPAGSPLGTGARAAPRAGS